MIYIGLFIVELLILFLLARSLQKRLSSLFYSILKKETTTIKILAIIFFPGTLLHEIAHAVMAHLLMVPVGEISLTPKIEGENVRLGSVAIAKTDIIRRILIGVAPFIIGNILILGLLYFAQTYTLWTNPLYLTIALYILFQVCNTMFSSKRDLEGVFSFTLFLALIGSIFYLLGFRISFQQFFGLVPEVVFDAFQLGSYYLLVPVGIDLGTIIFLSLLTKLFRIER